LAYTLGQAAKAVGRSKTTIHRAIAAGRLSASRTDAGEYAIDPSELMRAFPAERSANGPMERSVTDERLSAAQAERDRYRDIAEERLETIRDLRQRLDASEAERRNGHAQLTALLSDKREPPVAGKVPRWRRWFR
jgi:hypothetical protein